MPEQKTPRVLLVDDDSEALLSLARALKAAGCLFPCDVATTAAKATELIATTDFSAAVVDLSLTPKEGVESGFALLQHLVSTAPFCRAIVLTGHASIEHGVRALRLGAAHFLEKPADPKHLAALITDSVSQSNLRRAYQSLQGAQHKNLGAVVVGESAGAKELRDQIIYAASTGQAVFVNGETGTGKGLCAQAIHDFGPRTDRKFVRYQPSFSSGDLVNSDLFGHVKGAFTGATEDRRGLITEAQGGTLFLDEIDELPLETQVTLLGVLQDKKVRAVGSNKEQEINFRLVTASNQDIQKCIENGKLRKDFYHRAAHFQIHIPALRERLEDVPLLARHVLQGLREREQLAVFDFQPDAIEKLQNYRWPGNIRELQAVVEGAAYHAQFNGASHIKATSIRLTSQVEKPKEKKSFRDQVEDFQIKLIQEALDRNAGNQVRAAQELGLDRSSMRRIVARNS